MKTSLRAATLVSFLALSPALARAAAAPATSGNTAAAAPAVAANVTAIPPSALPNAASGQLQIRWVDVEGGGGTLIITPAGQSVLIDSGNPGNRDSARIAKAAQEAGLKKIDFYITTHFHVDHFGGASELAALIPIGQVYDRGLPDHEPDNNPNNAGWPRLRDLYANFKADKRNVIKAGDVIPLTQAATGPKLTLRCVAADQKFIPIAADASKNPLASENTPHAVDTSDNANSVALVLDYGPFRFFDGGDMTWNTEGEFMVPVNRVGQVDVYQVNHHGLGQSNNPVLVHSLAPTVSVMNNGIRKGTEQSTIEALNSTKSIVDQYQVHKNLRADVQDNTKDELIANISANADTCPANLILLTVAPDAKSYQVILPATAHTKTYQTRLDKPGPPAAAPVAVTPAAPARTP